MTAMADIVQRLRKHRHGFDRNGSHAAYRYVCLCDHDADEAADEIERLRSDLDREVAAHVADLAEIERLRELLREARGSIDWGAPDFQLLIDRIDAAIGNTNVTDSNNGA